MDTAGFYATAFQIKKDHLLLKETASQFAIIYGLKEHYNYYYDANGGNGTPMNQSVRIDGLNRCVTITSACPQKDGVVFAGWSTSADGFVQ